MKLRKVRNSWKTQEPSSFELIGMILNLFLLQIRSQTGISTNQRRIFKNCFRIELFIHYFQSVWQMTNRDKKNHTWEHPRSSVKPTNEQKLQNHQVVAWAEPKGGHLRVLETPPRRVTPKEEAWHGYWPIWLPSAFSEDCEFYKREDEEDGMDLPDGLHNQSIIFPLIYSCLIGEVYNSLHLGNLSIWWNPFCLYLLLYH